MSLAKNHLAVGNVFTVPDDIRLLTSNQVHLLESAFDLWRNRATRAEHIRARERMRLIFLLLRHTGARLGEVLGLDDHVDLDEQRSIVAFGTGAMRREVPLPQKLNQELHRILASPMGASGKGHFFHADQGQVRRAFYARAEYCGVPRELATARVLRNTRAVEMLRNGVPLAVVQGMLGQSSPELTAALQHYSSRDATTIVRRLALGEPQNRTSARNTFCCQITKVISDPVMAELTLETIYKQPLCAVITTESLHTLELGAGASVIASIKAPFVTVHNPAHEVKGVGSNQILATVTTVQSTPVMAEISGRTDFGQKVCSLVSTHAIQELNIKAGEQLCFAFKTLSVVINAL